MDMMLIIYSRQTGLALPKMEGSVLINSERGKGEGRGGIKTMHQAARVSISGREICGKDKKRRKEKKGGDSLLTNSLSTSPINNLSLFQRKNNNTHRLNDLET